MSTATQARQPKGVPIGGQFAATAHAEPNLRLTTAAGIEEDDAPDPTQPDNRVHDLPAHRLDAAAAKIEEANARLAKHGIEERFTYETEEYVKARTTVEYGMPVTRHEQRVRLTLNEPVLSFGGWRFVAAMDSTEAGFVARTAPGQSLDGWRPDNHRCDQCGTNRRRTVTYVVANADGDRKQIGSDCLEPFLGIKPRGLWALGYDLDLSELVDDDESTYSARHDSTVAPTRDLLATALAVSDGGREYLSRTKAMDWEKTATADLASEVLFGVPRTSKDAQHRDEIMTRAAQYDADGTVDEVLAAVEAMDGDGDYATNLKTVLAAEHTSPRHLGIAVSAIGVWRRGKELAAAKAAITPGFVAPVGAKIAGTRATVAKVVYVDNPYDYHGGVNTIVIFTAEDGRQMKWMASGRKDFEVGQVGVFGGGTVKKHDQYRGVDQTVITRAKFAPDVSR